MIRPYGHLSPSGSAIRQQRWLIGLGSTATGELAALVRAAQDAAEQSLGGMVAVVGLDAVSAELERREGLES